MSCARQTSPADSCDSCIEISRGSACGSSLESVAAPLRRWRIHTHADIAGKARDAAVGKFLVAKSDGLADGWGRLAFTIAEPRADGELGAVRQADEQCAEP